MVVLSLLVGCATTRIAEIPTIDSSGVTAMELLPPEESHPAILAADTHKLALTAADLEDIAALVGRVPRGPYTIREMRVHFEKGLLVTVSERGETPVKGFVLYRTEKGWQMSRARVGISQ